MELRHGILSLAGLLAASLGACAPAFGQAVVTRVTGPQPWRAANADSEGAWSPERNGMAISADNRWVVFESGASNLAPYDKNPFGDIFVFEVATGRIVEITSDENFTANGASYDPAISGNGRWIVFVSNASNLVAYDSNGSSDVFLVDRDLDGNGIFDELPYVFERVSIDSSGNQSHGSCTSPCVTDDGYRVLYLSDAFDLVDNDNNFATDAFLYDRAYGTTDRVDVDPSGNEAIDGCSFADMTPDGNVVAFCSDSDNLVPNDWNQLPDVFLRDLGAGTTELISADPSGTPGDLQSDVFRHCLSADGRYVAFQSFADNLASDTNGRSDVFLRDRWSGATTLVSIDSKGGVQGNGDSGQPTLSADGSRITFVSAANNLAAGDANKSADVFLRDTGSGGTTLLSASINGGSSNGSSGAATISADGTQVVLSSDSSDLVATGDVRGFRDVFLRDLSTGTIRYVSAVAAGDPNGPSMLATDSRSAFDLPALSADGRFVAFESEATNLFDGDDNGAADVFVADRSTGAIVPISVTSSGISGDGRSFHPTMSSTGRFVAFASEATTLVVSDANGSVRDVLLCDRDPDANGVFDEGNATISLVSVDSSGVQANDWSDSPSISGDGAHIAFTSAATNLGDTTPNADIFAREPLSGQTFAMTSSSNLDGCDRASMSSDGTSIAYTRYYSNFYGQFSQVIEYTPVLWGFGAYVLIEDSNSGSPASYPSSYAPCNSANGARVVVFSDTPYGSKGFTVHDIPFGVTQWAGTFAGPLVPAMNPSGRQVTVDTASSLSSNDTNTARDVYVFDLPQKEDGSLWGNPNPILVSTSMSGAAGNADSVLAVPSEDGNLVVFASDASDLVTGDTNGCRDVFLFDRTTTARWLNYGSGFAGNHGIPGFTSDSAPVLGSTITLSFGNSSGVPVNALVFLSLKDANVGLPWGATFLVDLSTALRFLVPLGAAGGAVPGTVPNDPALAGVPVYLQALEYDAGVPHKLSFTPGLELCFGF